MQDEFQKRESTYWFSKRYYGYGWGFPTCWQGWVALLVYLALVTLAVWYYAVKNTSPMGFVLALLVLSAGLFTVCYLKGPRPRWRWGDND